MSLCQLGLCSRSSTSGGLDPQSGGSQTRIPGRAQDDRPLLWTVKKRQSSPRQCWGFFCAITLSSVLFPSLPCPETAETTLTVTPVTGTHR